LPGIRQLSDIFDPSQPLFVDQTEPTTLNVAVSKADIPVAVPGYLPPKVDPKPEVWYSGETGEVGLRYGDALVVDYAPWNSDQTPQDEYPNLAQQWGAGEATTIGGHPAWVIAAGSAGSEDDSVSVVYLGLKGVEVNLSGKIPVDELVKVAASISSQGNPG
jgi:hypothetical protein